MKLENVMEVGGVVRPVRAVAVGIVLMLVAAACVISENPFESLVETSVAGGDVTADLGSQLQIPEPSTLIIDEDPNSPIAATVMFEEGDHLVERIDFLGPKPSTNRPPTTALVYLKGFDEAFGIAMDADGLPSVMYLVDVGELRFSFSGGTMTVTFMAPDGSTSTEAFALDGGDSAVESMESPSGGRDMTGVRAAFRNAAVEVYRAVFIDVSVWTPDGELPRDLGAPFLQTDGCHATRSDVTYACDRVGARLVEARDDVRVYRLAMTHTASAVVEGLDASIWPSAQACEAALGNDWWVEAPVAAGLEVSSVGLGKALLSWFAASPEIVAASATVGTAYLPAVAIAGTVAIFFSLGNWAGEQLSEGGEGTCERIKRRVAAMNMLGSTVGDIAFTVEVCLPPTSGWTVERACQKVGPYQPFSAAMQTTVGDAATLGRNRIPSVDFVITPVPGPVTETVVDTPAPGSVTGAVVDAGTGDPIAGAVVTLEPEGVDTVTDANGRLTFTAVSVGIHTITVTATGYTDTTTQVEVETDQTIETTITLDPSILGVWNVSGVWMTGGGWVDGTMMFSIDGSVSFGWEESWGNGNVFARTGAGVWSISGDMLTTSLQMFAHDMVYEGVYVGRYGGDGSATVLVSDDWNFTLTR